MERQRYECRLGDMTLTITERTYTRHDKWREYTAAPRMYVDVQDETIMENLMNRRSRPYNAYKTLIHGSLLHQVLSLGKLQWSQHAGCTCNCSPGFILPTQTLSIGGMQFRHFDVWLTFSKTLAVAAAV